MNGIMLAFILSAPGAVGQDIAPMALNSFTAPPRHIAMAPVMDEQGHTMGHVRAVQTDQDGKVSAVSVVPEGQQDLVIFSAAVVSYDEPHNILVTSADPQRLAQN